MRFYLERLGKKKRMAYGILEQYDPKARKELD